MSKIKNGGLDQYGKAQSLSGIGGERVKVDEDSWIISFNPFTADPVKALGLQSAILV